LAGLIPIFVIWPWFAEPVRDQGDTVTLQSIQFYYGGEETEVEPEPEPEIDPFDIDPDASASYGAPSYSYGMGPLRLK
jgi:hypothetical protein